MEYVYFLGKVSFDISIHVFIDSTDLAKSMLMNQNFRFYKDFFI